MLALMIPQSRGYHPIRIQKIYTSERYISSSSTMLNSEKINSAWSRMQYFVASQL